MRNIYSALDIGSDTIKLVVGEFIGSKFNILCACSVPSYGFTNNVIENKDELISTIKNLLNEVYDKIGFEVKKIILNIPTVYNNFLYTEGDIKLDDDEVVTGDHVSKVLQKSASGFIPNSEELIGISPVMFKVGDVETKEPINKKGKSLSVRSILVSSDKRYIYSFLKVVESAGLSVIDITTCGLSDYLNFDLDKFNNKNGVVINLGNTSTTVNIYSKGIFINSEVINIGGSEIDNDIIEHYNLKRSDTKYLKENFILASSQNASLNKVMKFYTLEGTEVSINQYEISEVVKKRVIDILNLTKKTINHLTKKEISYIIVTGGLTELKDIALLINDCFEGKAKIGKINYIGARDNKYSTAIGAIMYFNNKLRVRDKNFCMISDDDIDTLVNGAKIVTNDGVLGKVFGYFFDN